jgi:hypothetical protein
MSSLGDAKSSLGDAKSSLGDAKSSLSSQTRSGGRLHEGRRGPGAAAVHVSSALRYPPCHTHAQREGERWYY